MLEMAETARRGISTIQFRMQRMIRLGLVNPPPVPGQARAYTLTAKGLEIYHLYNAQQVPA